MIEIDVDSKELIGKGCAAEVYKDGDKVIKLYYDKTTKDTAEYFYNLANHTMNLGVPVVKNYDFVTAKGRYGIVFDYFSGESLDNYYKKNKEDRFECAKIMGEMLRKLHSIDVFDGARKYTETGIMGAVSKMAMLPEDITKEIVSLIQNMPGPRVMVHGDYHEGNIMINEDGPRLIDLDTLSIGSPILDLGYVYLGHKIQDDSIREERYGVSLDVMNESLFVFLEAYFGIQSREILKKYDEQINHMMNFMVFLYSLGSASSLGEEAYKKHIEAGCQTALNELRMLNDNINVINWRN